MLSNENIEKNKKQLALSSIMFFAPLIKNLITKNKLKNKLQSYINGFINLWYIHILLLILTIIWQILFFQYQIELINYISTVFIAILTLSIIWSSLLILTDKQISHNTKEININALLSYIPLYNIYLWYKKHNFENPNKILKESIIIRIVFIILLQINIIAIYILSTIILIRVLMLTLNINIFYDKLINIFTKNPEEIRGYITWYIAWIQNKEYKKSIKTHKQKFEILFKIDNNQIKIEYILLTILCLLWFRYWYIQNNINIIIAILFVILRYLILYLNWNHLPHIPILYGITKIFFNKNN